jgi:hypothetical protein
VVECLAAYQPQDEQQAESVAGCMALASTLAVKIARVAGYIGDGRDSRSVGLGREPNILLIEHLRDRLRSALEAAEPSAPPERSALNELSALDAQLAPMLAPKRAPRRWRR